MSSVEITVEHDAETDKAMHTRTPSGHDVVLDSKPDPGGEGPTPVEMLLASVGACSLMDVAVILRKKKYEVEGLRVRVEGQRREDHPRRFDEINLVYEIGGNVTQQDLEDACELSVDKYCSVVGTLDVSPQLGWEAHAAP